MGKHSELYLAELAHHAHREVNSLLRKKGLESSMNVAAICLYGSAAQVHFGRVATYNDHDLQVFLCRENNYRKNDVSGLNRYGAPWCLGEYEGKKVEVFFGLLDERNENLLKTIREYARNNRSPRWEGHRRKPFLVLWPIRADWPTVM